VFDDPRDPWRADFLKRAAPMVKDATSASEAAQILNRDFFKQINTHYNTMRKRTNQSPKESIEQGKATCTGLSIILVDVCRAVGIPARAVGTPMWTNGRGNHTWVEIWDGEWKFTGADEYNQKGLNHGWFTKDAAKAKADQPQHAIYATSWKKDGVYFPLVWSQKNTTVAAVNVTQRYAKQVSDQPVIGIRLSKEGSGDQRIVARGVLTSASGRMFKPFQTKAGKADLNDMPRVSLQLGPSYRLRFEVGDQTLETGPFEAVAGESTMDLVVSKLRPVPDVIVALSKDPVADIEFGGDQSKRIIQLLAELEFSKDAAQRLKELKGKSMTQGDKTMKWLEKTYGKAPKGGHSLWISMHGGGNAPHEANKKQWQNQIQLYQPKEGIYLAPRAPTNTWNLWHQPHIDPLFSRLIESMVMLRGVNPDKVYLMGYSAGGDGVWQLAPRMADRFAAASMMAGHPNESQLDGVRNLPFGLFMGANDFAFKRNKLAVERAKKLIELQEADPGGYTHMTRIYSGMGHWMKLKDVESVPWMAKFSRQTWPDKIVWYQDDVTHDRFYWLQLPKGVAEKKQRIVAMVDDQKVKLTGDVPKGIQLLLHDTWIDIDRPIQVTVNDQPSITYNAKRGTSVVRKALENRLDPSAAPTAVVVIE